MSTESETDRGGRQLDARTAYQVAANLYMQENAITWSRFNIMLTANSIIIAATGVAAGGAHPLYLLAATLPVAGCVLCFIWWKIMARGFVYHNMWRDSAYSIERSFFSDGLNPINTLHFADQLRSEGRVEVPVPGKGARPHDVPTRDRAMRFANWVIWMFAALYILAFVQVMVLLRQSSA
jgi:hypothetical protein